jgi:hypothetical protein
MATPKPVSPKCDVFGCGHAAEYCTDGTEVDSQNRKSTKGLNVCLGHMNWPHSEDAQRFALTDEYAKRK